MVNIELFNNGSLVQSTADLTSTPSTKEVIAEWGPFTQVDTVAALTQQGASLDLDDFDWWYTASFDSDVDSARTYFCSDGLATCAEVWLNGEQVLVSNSMFVRHKIDITDKLQQHNTFHVVFRALNPQLSERRPRPAWKTNLVDQQNLRWFRTTLLGRIPGWTPPVKTVGPWQPIYIETHNEIDVLDYSIVPKLSAEEKASVQLGLELEALPAFAKAAKMDSELALYFVINNQEYAIPYKLVTGGNVFVECELQLEKINPWWPHTHGEPVLYEYQIRLDVAGKQCTLKTGRLGFKRVRSNAGSADLAFEINGARVFCRGACWTAPELNHVATRGDVLRQLLTTLKESGANMIRIGGTMVYEADEFYALCDELGILVWQDFMFANMDYPFSAAEKTFTDLCGREVRQQLTRLSQHACLAVLCGGSEVYQQAAMMGIEEASWSSELFESYIPERIREQGCDLPYFPSSPCGGSLPFHTDAGLAHYYGVGAYKFNVDHHSVRSVQFTPECLGFSNIPVTASLKEAFGSAYPPVHSPAWKAGVPRDSSAGWDFEDIRDHYLSQKFSVSPSELRYSDNETYFQLATVAPAEVMQEVMSVWRSHLSRCRGALMWFYSDIIAGAGWGIVDFYHRPKSAYYLLKRTWQPVQVCVCEDGLQGHTVTVLNETGEEAALTLTVALIGMDAQILEERTLPVNVNARAQDVLSVDTLFGRFLDTTHVYKFGRQKIYAVVAELRDDKAELVSQSVHFPSNHRQVRAVSGDILGAIDSETGNRIELRSDKFVEYAVLEAKKTVFADNYICMLPNHTYRVEVMGGERIKSVSISALNLIKDFRLV